MFDFLDFFVQSFISELVTCEAAFYMLATVGFVGVVKCTMYLMRGRKRL